MTKNKLTEKAATYIMVNLLCNKLFILAPLYFKQFSGFSTFIVTTFVFAITLIIWNIYCRFCSVSLLHLIKYNFTRKFVIIIIVFITTVITSLTIRQYSLELKSSVLYKTPLWLITSVFLAVVLYAFRCNLYAVGSSAIILVPIIFLTASILVLCSVSANDIYNFFPLFSINYTKTISQILLMLSMLYEVIFLYFMPVILENPAEIKSVGNKSILWSFTYFIIISVIFSITLPEYNSTQHEPFFKIIKQAHLGNYAIKFDSLFLILYCISAFVYTSSLLLLTHKIIDRSFSRKCIIIIKPILIIIIFAVSLIPALSIATLKTVDNYYYILSIIAFALPTFIVLSNKVVKQKSKK